MTEQIANAYDLLMWLLRELAKNITESRYNAGEIELDDMRREYRNEIMRQHDRIVSVVRAKERTSKAYRIVKPARASLPVKCKTLKYSAQAAANQRPCYKMCTTVSKPTVQRYTWIEQRARVEAKKLPTHGAAFIGKMIHVLLTESAKEQARAIGRYYTPRRATGLSKFSKRYSRVERAILAGASGKIEFDEYDGEGIFTEALTYYAAPQVHNVKTPSKKVSKPRVPKGTVRYVEGVAIVR